VVAAALGLWGTAEQRGGPLASLLAGEATAAWAQSTTSGAARSVASVVHASERATGVVLTGSAGPVEGAAEATHLLVTAASPSGRTQHLVSMAADGVEQVPLRGLDLTRRYHEVVLHEVELPAGSQVGERGGADEQDEHLLDLVATMLGAEMVGATAHAFATTLEWTVDRYSFGRPLGSYQAIKHRMADARTQLEACEALASRAATALGRGDADARHWASATMALAASRAPEIVQECVQFHGGIGVTYELDLHLYLRRVVVDSTLHGSASDFARRLGGLVIAAAGDGEAA
jgi:alkylation response protein AidB-like acyl-CoA dehydrogenase